MTTLAELHRQFRAADQTDRERARRRQHLEARQLGYPAAQPECSKAIRHDADATGACRWCKRVGIKRAALVPDHPWELNGGVIQVDEMYDYHFGNDEADLPAWYVRHVHEEV